MNDFLESTEITQAETGRDPNDYYPTPEPITQALIDARLRLPTMVVEPCSGNDAIATVLRGNKHTVSTYDIQRSPTHDATQKHFWESVALGFRVANLTDWAVVTNPPFSIAHQIIPLAYEYSPWGIAMLLRLTYLEPAANRAEWLQDHADNLRLVMPVNPRPRFKKSTKGTDSCTVAWMVWDKRWSWRSLGIESPLRFLSGWR